MAYGDEEEKPLGRFRRGMPNNPGHETAQLFGYYALNVLWIAVSASCFYYSYDLAKNGKALKAVTSLKAGLLTYDGALAGLLAACGLGIGIYALRRLSVD